MADQLTNWMWVLICIIYNILRILITHPNHLLDCNLSLCLCMSMVSTKTNENTFVMAVSLIDFTQGFLANLKLFW